MTKSMQRLVASATLLGLLAGITPMAPALANGAASTRNILLGGAAAAYLIIEHNRAVHAKYAADARQQAATAQQRNDAWAAYNQEQRAYNEQVAVNRELQKEVAYQHNIVAQQRQELAASGMHQSFATTSTTRVARVANSHARAKTNEVAMTSYGWGTL